MNACIIIIEQDCLRPVAKIAQKLLLVNVSLLFQGYYRCEYNYKKYWFNYCLVNVNVKFELLSLIDKD